MWIWRYWLQNRDIGDFLELLVREYVTDILNLSLN